MELFGKVYTKENTQQIILDIDSTHVDTYGNQENTDFNYHYSSNGYHPHVLCNGFNGDLLKVELRKGSVYTSNGIRGFLEHVLQWLKKMYPDAMILLRGDSGYATPELYELMDEYSTEFIVKLKSNAKLKRIANSYTSEFHEFCNGNYTKKNEFYTEFIYKAESWKYSRRVVMKMETDPGSFVPRTTFIVTTLTSDPKTIVKVYNKRGNMENFIKESKLDYGMDSLSHSSFLANAIKYAIRALAYNLMNLMKRQVLPSSMRTQRALTLRTIIIKFVSSIHDSFNIFDFIDTTFSQTIVVIIFNCIDN